MNRLVMFSFGCLALAACAVTDDTQEKKTQASVARQQSQYNIGQPIPAYDFSVERDLLIQIYNLRNMKVSTHAVWRSDLGTIEGDCSSMGFGLPYDTSLTNPWKPAYRWTNSASSAVAIGQAEPNGIFASTNTAATWVLCIGSGGALEPIYIETKVTVYPYPVEVDYDTNRVTQAGKATVTITPGKSKGKPKKAKKAKE